MRLRSIRRAALLAAAVASAPGCRDRGASLRRIPSRFALELSRSDAPLPAAIVPRLRNAGVAELFVPAVRMLADGASARTEILPSPASRYPFPIYLEVEGVGNFDAYLDREKEKAAETIWKAASAALESRKYGPIAGLHLGLRVRKASSEYGRVLRFLRRRLPARLTLSASVDTPLSEKERAGWKACSGRLDFVVAGIFGRVPGPAPEGDRLGAELSVASKWGVPIAARISPVGWGVAQRESEAPAEVSDENLNALSEDRRFDFEFGGLLTDSAENVYVFTARGPVRNGPGGISLRARDTITFREPRPADLLAAFSASRDATARIVRAAGFSEEEGLIGVPIIEDLLLGRRIEPKLRFELYRNGGEVTFVAVNAAPEFSELSRLNNWVDVRFQGASLRDVQPGDFDRFELYDGAGRRVLPPLARRVRFIENFVAPGESMTGGPMRFSGTPRVSVSYHLALPDGTVIDSRDVAIGTPLDEDESGQSGQSGGNGGPGR